MLRRPDEVLWRRAYNRRLLMSQSPAPPSEADKIAQVYCPHMDPIDGQYVRTTRPHTLVHRGKTIEYRTCCAACAKAIRSSPDTYLLEADGARVPMRHRTTNAVVQYGRIVASK